jgi:TRAP-type C4-dicarboxylate transport system substrate-binding protein
VRKRSWVWRLAAVVAALALALGLAACGGDDDDEGGATTAGDGAATDVVYVTTQQHPYGIAVDAFVKGVNATGAITLRGQPGYPQAEIQLLDSVRSGAVKMATISSAIFDTADITAFQALQAPFLVTNYQLEQEVLTGSIGQQMIADGTEQAGDLQVLTIHEGGLRKPFGVTKLVDPAAFNGKTIRAPQSQVLADGLAALGANVDPLPLPDVGPALQNGTVDGVEANLPLIYTQKWYENAKYITGNVNLWPFPTVLVANKDFYDGLSADQQKALTDEAAKLPAASIAIFTNPNPPVNYPQELVNCGAEFVSSTPAQLTQLSNAGKEAIAGLPSSTQDFVTQIQQLKDAQPPLPTPPPFPTAKTGDCVPPPS